MAMVARGLMKDLLLQRHHGLHERPGVQLGAPHQGLLPRQVLIYSAVLSLAVDFAFELLVLIIIAMIMGGPGVFLMIPALLVVTLLAGMFAVGLGLILSVGHRLLPGPGPPVADLQPDLDCTPPGSSSP